MENSFDIGISEFFKQFIDSTGYQKIFTTISGFYLFIVVIAVLFLFNKDRRKVGVLILITFICTTLINDYCLKSIFKRERPFVYFGLETSPGFLITGYSFPSGHSIAISGGAFAFFFYYLLIEKNMKGTNLAYSIIFFIISLAVMISRVTLLHHYFTDCLTGCILGCIISLIVILIYKVIINYKKKKLQD